MDAADKTWRGTVVVAGASRGDGQRPPRLLWRLPCFWVCCLFGLAGRLRRGGSLESCPRSCVLPIGPLAAATPPGEGLSAYRSPYAGRRNIRRGEAGRPLRGRPASPLGSLFQFRPDVIDLASYKTRHLRA